MQALPLPARLYLINIWVVALAILAYLAWSFSLATTPLWFAIWVLGFVIGDYYEVTFEIAGDHIGMTTSEAIVIFLVVAGGPTAVFAVVLGTLIVEILRRRAWYRAAFNMATRAITVSAMIGLYQLIHVPGAPTFGTPWELVVFVIVAITFYVLSALLVNMIVALATREPVQKVYRSSYGLVQWIHLLTFPIGALMAAHWSTNRWLLLFDVLVLIIAQRSFSMVAALQVESHRRQELADERARLLSELQQQQEELIRASKLAALGTFSSGIAHEFNNLLTVIMGHAQLGLLNDSPPELRESLDLTVRACRRGRSITTSLLTFARQGDTQRVMQQVREVVDDTLAMVEHEFANEGIRIERHLEPVPPTYCDPGQILQVVLNLLTNARDAIGEGSGVIGVTLAQEQQQIVLSIADNGAGMSPEVQAQIFQPFVTTKAPGKGTGLGLAICYGIMESHGGSIGVISAPGKGTTMTVRLPIVMRDEQAFLPASEPQFLATREEILEKH